MTLSDVFSLAFRQTGEPNTMKICTNLADVFKANMGRCSFDFPPFQDGGCLYRVPQHNFLFLKLNKTHDTNQNCFFICFSVGIFLKNFLLSFENQIRLVTPPLSI